MDERTVIFEGFCSAICVGNRHRNYEMLYLGLKSSMTFIETQ